MRKVYMNKLRFNIILDRDVSEKLKKIKNKSRFINDALREKMNRSKEQKNKYLLRRSYIESIQQDIKMAQEWSFMDGDAL